MKTSIATVSISGTLDEKLEAIAAAGYDGIELFEQDFIAFDGSPRDFRARVQDHGLEISMFQPLRDFEGLQHIIYGAILILVLRTLPGGLISIPSVLRRKGGGR